MPRHDVGVVLHDREHDLVAGLEVHAERGRHQIGRIRQVAGENDLVGARRVEEAAHDLARLLELGGRGVGEIVQAAMHVGVYAAVDALDGVEHHTRLLGGGAVVEIDQRLAVHLRRKDREVGADRLDIERSGAD
jgi:hypothetical protein